MCYFFCPSKMKLVVPVEFRRLPEYYSLKKLWIHEKNIHYVKIQIIYAVHRLKPSVSELLQRNLSILKFVDEYMAEYSCPELNRSHENTLGALHYLNKTFILQTAQEIANNPNVLNPEYGYDFETGFSKITLGEKCIDAGAFADGTYHPEALFTQCSQNAKSPYWQPLEVSVDFSKPSVYNRLQTDAGDFTQIRPWESYKRFYADPDHHYSERTTIPGPLGY